MIFTFDSVNWFNKLIRPFFATIDAVIYRLIGWILEGILNLSDLFANPTFVNTIYRRIYVVLAIFMVFKLTFSFIQYIVNPDAMTDKEKGVGKLISRTIVMLVLIIFVPILFFEEITVPGGSKGTLLNVLQRGVLKTLPQVVLGVDSNEVNKNSGSDGESIALMMLGSLYYKTDCESSKSNCETGLKAAISDFDAFEGSVNINDSGKFDYKYMWPLTTVAGIMLAVILLGIAIDVAVRVFKIMVLQMVAPIPIMSYIDPKASKDGAFASWLKMYISTYLDVFIKVGTVYLLMLIIGNLFTDNGIFGTQIKAHTSFMTRSFLIIFLTIGLFKFAKDAPKFIKDAMGIKDSGGGGIFGGLKALGAATGAIAGGVTGFAGGVAGGIASAKAAGQNGFMGAMKGLGGGVAGAFRGTAQGAKGAAKGNPFKGIGGAMQSQSAINQRKVTAASAGSTWLGRMGVRGQEMLGMQSGVDRDLEDAKNLNAAAGNLKTIRDTARDKGFINRGLDIARNINGVQFGAGTHALFKDAFENASREGHSSFNFTDSSGTTRNISMQDAGAIYKNLTDAVSDTYLSTYSLGSNATIDAAFEDYRTNMDAVSDGNSIAVVADASGVTKAHSDAVASRGAHVRSGVNPDRARRYKANKDAIKRGK